MNAQSPALQEVNKDQPAYLYLTLSVNRDALILLFFFVLVHLFYFPTWNAGFVADFTGLAGRIETHSFWNFLNSFDFPSLHPVLHLFSALFYKSFGVRGFPWYVIFTSFHIINAFMLFRISRKLMRAFEVYQAEAIAFAGSLLFLLSPYASEPVTWRFCFGFLLVSQFILAILRHTIRWLETGERRYQIFILALLAAALFTSEQSLIIPLLTTALMLLWRTQFPSKGLLQVWFRQLLLPQLLLIAGWFILHKIILGIWAELGDPAVYLTPAEILANNFKYLAKYLFFARYWEPSYKTMLFTGIDKSGWLFTFLFVALAFAYIWFYKKISPSVKLAGWFLLAFFIALLPVLHLHFNYLLQIENDRYGYLPSLFFTLFLMTLISTFPRWLGYSFFAVYLSISGYYLQRTNHIWADATKVYYSLLNDFRWYDKQEVYVLNLPDNLQGSPLFRDYTRQDSTLKDALRYIGRKPYNGIIHEVAQYNMTILSDGVSAERKNNTTLFVTFNQSGNEWWRRGGVGAPAYEQEAFSFTPRGQSYELHLAKPSKSAVFIYQKGGKWEQLKQ